MRADGRRADEMRPVTITRDFLRHAEGSVLITVGETRVICTASLEERVPTFLRGQRKGWITAEYGMLPRSTLTVNFREIKRVQFLVDGQEMTVVAGDLDLRRPVQPRFPGEEAQPVVSLPQ